MLCHPIWVFVHEYYVLLFKIVKKLHLRRFKFNTGFRFEQVELNSDPDELIRWCTQPYDPIVWQRQRRNIFYYIICRSEREVQKKDPLRGDRGQMPCDFSFHTLWSEGSPECEDSRQG